MTTYLLILSQYKNCIVSLIPITRKQFFIATYYFFSIFFYINKVIKIIQLIVNQFV